MPNGQNPVHNLDIMEGDYVTGMIFSPCKVNEIQKWAWAACVMRDDI